MALEFDVPATYRIRVKGYLDDRWSDRLGGMEISPIDRVEGGPERNPQPYRRPSQTTPGMSNLQPQ